MWVVEARAGLEAYTEAIIASGKFEHAGLYDDKGKVLVETEGFGVKPEEIVSLAVAIDAGAAKVQVTPFELAGERYAFRKAESGNFAVGKRDARLGVVMLARRRGRRVVLVGLSKKFLSSRKVLAVLEDQKKNLARGVEPKPEQDEAPDGGVGGAGGSGGGAPGARNPPR
jgi:hypothetical protein